MNNLKKCQPKGSEELENFLRLENSHRPPPPPPSKATPTQNNVALAPKVDIPRLFRRLDTFRDTPALTDEIVVVGKAKFPCHKCVLALSARFVRDRMRSSKSVAEVLAPPGVSSATFPLVLDCLYCKEIQINKGNVRQLMKSASALQFQVLWRRCESYLRRHLAEFTEREIEAILAMEVNMDTTLVRRLCWDTLAGREKMLCRTFFLGADARRLDHMLRSDRLPAYSEDDVLQAFALWVASQARPDWGQIRPLLFHLRFPLAYPSPDQVKCLREIAGDLQWMIDEGVAARTDPHLYQWIPSRSLTPRYESSLDACIFVVGSPVYLDHPGPSPLPAGWQVAAFNLRTSSWFLPRIAEISTGELLLDYQDTPDHLPSACAFGNGFFLAFGDSGEHVMFVDALNSRGKRLQGVPREKDYSLESSIDADASLFTGGGVSLRVSGRTLVASRGGEESGAFVCSVHGKKWLRASARELQERYPVYKSETDAEKVKTKYMTRYRKTEHSVGVVRVGKDWYVVDGDGRVRWYLDGVFEDVATIDGFQGRERFGVVQQAGTIYVIGGVTQNTRSDVSKFHDVIRVNVLEPPFMVDRLASSMPCPMIHAAFRLLVRKASFKGRRVS